MYVVLQLHGSQHIAFIDLFKDAVDLVFQMEGVEFLVLHIHQLLAADVALQDSIREDNRHKLQALVVDDAVDEGKRHIGRDDNWRHFDLAGEVDVIASFALHRQERLHIRARNEAGEAPFGLAFGGSCGDWEGEVVGVEVEGLFQDFAVLADVERRRSIIHTHHIYGVDVEAGGVAVGDAHERERLEHHLVVEDRVVEAVADVFRHHQDQH
mmetsp:Transcript_20119/g.36148  ORF Transcript_20119/g.36148 Transcript_20119/m.36148 type:complete len:211 (-) Transcript_20119:1592-2224(-)